jgi:hypothetical protein
MRALGVIAGLVVPWTVLAIVIFTGRQLAERLVIGVVGGLAATVTLGYVLAAWGRLDLYGYIFAAALALVLALLLKCRNARAAVAGGHGGKARRKKASCSAPVSGPSNAEPTSQLPFAPPAIPWFAAALLAILAAEAIPTLSTDFPIGWDPAFHAILSQKILDSNELARDWLPFEDIGVNYSQGLHVLIALVSAWSGQQVHETFQLLHLVIQPLAAIMVYLLATCLIRNWQGSVLAMLIYALLCNFGSFYSYYQWGGIPTELGSLFLLTALWMALTGSDRWSGGLRVILFGSLILVHNLGAVIGTAVILFYLLMDWVSRRRETRLADTVKGDTAIAGGGLARRLTLMLPLTLLAYSFYIVPYALRASGLESTDVLQFRDEEMMTWADIIRNVGYSALALGVVGMILHSRQASDEGGHFLLCWFTSLVLCFCLLGYVYRFAAIFFFQQDVAAFTPSRFLTVLSYPLSVYGGYALTVALRWAQRSVRLAGGVGLGVLAGAIAVSAVPDVNRLAQRRSVSDEAEQLGGKIRLQTPENAFVFYAPEARELMGPPEWIPYLTWRATVYTPIPASENRQAVREKRRLFQSPDRSEAVAWIAAHGFEAFVIHQNDEGSFALSRAKFR